MDEGTFISFPEYQRLSTRFARTNYLTFFKYKSIFQNSRKEMEWLKVHSFGSPSIWGLAYALLVPITHISQKTISFQQFLGLKREWVNVHSFCSSSNRGLVYPLLEPITCLPQEIQFNLMHFISFNPIGFKTKTLINIKFPFFKQTSINLGELNNLFFKQTSIAQVRSSLKLFPSPKCKHFQNHLLRPSARPFITILSPKRETF